MDILKIKEDFESLLVHSQDYPFNVDSANLIKQWLKAKDKFIKMFHGNTFIRSQERIKVSISEKQKTQKFNEFLNILDSHEVLTDEFREFLENNQEGFFSNRVLSPFPERNIVAGMKLSKSFKRFLNNKIVRWAQDQASCIMQEDKIEGYLYLSVDPKDFMTLSENNENWSSCQSLDGDFRTGNISYMVDDVTLIAYLASEQEESLKCCPPDVKCFSKKWRMLIHSDGENQIYYSRQYPYDCNDLLLATYEMLSSIFKVDFESPYQYGFRTFRKPDDTLELLTNNCITIDGGRVFDTFDIVDTSEYLGFSDLISSSKYSPVISFNNRKLREYRNCYGYLRKPYQSEFEAVRGLAAIKIGKNAICPCCGKEELFLVDSFLCESCIKKFNAERDFFVSCDCCNRRIYPSDEYFYQDDDTLLCKRCNDALLEDDKGEW